MRIVNLFFLKGEREGKERKREGGGQGRRKNVLDPSWTPRMSYDRGIYPHQGYPVDSEEDNELYHKGGILIY